jgi:hypothetical protein
MLLVKFDGFPQVLYHCYSVPGVLCELTIVTSTFLTSSSIWMHSNSCIDFSNTVWSFWTLPFLYIAWIWFSYLSPDISHFLLHPTTRLPPVGDCIVRAFQNHCWKVIVLWNEMRITYQAECAGVSTCIAADRSVELIILLGSSFWFSELQLKLDVS